MFRRDVPEDRLCLAFVRVRGVFRCDGARSTEGIFNYVALFGNPFRDVLDEREAFSSFTGRVVCVLLCEPSRVDGNRVRR